MYGLSLYSELAELRGHYISNQTLIRYYSSALTQVQLFAEFFFEVINERCEPLVLAFELFKAVCKLKQYK